MVQEKTDKVYGVLHTENYFSFYGFCKKVNRDEIQFVDVYLDDEKIDSIQANQSLDKISDIYDLSHYGFEYHLPKHFIGQKHTLHFKNHATQEELKNSPYELIDKNNPYFNEASFLHSLSQPIDEDQLKDLYCPNSIGFLATKENLEDEEFVGYIKELMERFPEVEFKGFCFDDEQKNRARNILTKKGAQVILPTPLTIYDLAQKIEVFVTPINNIHDMTVKHIIKYNHNIMLSIFNSKDNFINTKLNKMAKVQKGSHKYLILKEVGIPDVDIEKNNYDFLISLWSDFLKKNNIDYVLNSNITLREFRDDRMELGFKNPLCKKYIVELNFALFKVYGWLK